MRRLFRPVSEWGTSSGPAVNTIPGSVVYFDATVERRNAEVV